MVHLSPLLIGRDSRNEEQNQGRDDVRYPQEKPEVQSEWHEKIEHATAKEGRRFLNRKK